jgi:hypothetical protein
VLCGLRIVDRRITSLLPSEVYQLS